MSDFKTNVGTRKPASFNELLVQLGLQLTPQVGSPISPTFAGVFVQDVTGNHELWYYDGVNAAFPLTDGGDPAGGTTALLTGFVRGAGTVAATDTILQGINKLDGNTYVGLHGYNTTATSTGNLILVATSAYQQYFTGATTHTVTLPDVTTLILGWQYQVVNNSSGAVTINSSGGNLVQTVAANSSAVVTCIALTGTGAGSWSVLVAMPPLNDANIFVGNALNAAVGVPMSGEASILNTGAITLDNGAVIGKLLTGFLSGAGTVLATDSILEALQKLDGNIAALPEGSGRRQIFDISGGLVPPASGAVGGTLGFFQSQDFDPDTNNDIFFQFALPDNVDVTQDVKIVLKYCMSTNNGGDVKLNLDYIASDLGSDVDPAAATDTLTSTFTPGAGAEIFRRHQLFIIDNADITSIDMGFACHLTRDAVAGGDTHTGKFQLLTIEIEYTPIELGAGSSGSGDGWVAVGGADYTAAPASTSTLTMLVDHTANIFVGMSLRYTIAGTVKYARVSAITAGLLTVSGAPLSGAVTNLQYGGGEVTEMVLPVNGTYEDASNAALLVSDNKMPLIWRKEKSYAVYYQVWSRLKDTGASGQASVRINNTELNTVAGGLTVAANDTWYYTGVDIDVAAYDINPGEAIEVTAIKGGNGDAEDLCIILILVTP